MQDSLFGATPSLQPLAARLRPRTLGDYVGQSHLLGTAMPLRIALEQGVLHSMILWGPPGVGKTTLARLFAETTKARFESLSAVLSGVKEIREAVTRAQAARFAGQQTLLFVDEVHRFNKAQQDAFLPHIEDGTFIFIGATTENPSFELNSALLSRARVYVLKPLTNDDLSGLLARALTTPEGLADRQLRVDEPVRQQLITAADGDARRLLNFLEIAADIALREDDGWRIDASVMQSVLQTSWRRFDKGGDQFYDQISALHKSIRGSDPDAALYWLCRMLDGGCDPLYLARRLVRMASEDIGNADPQALGLTLDAWHTQERLGSPEGELALAQAAVYLAVTTKSNAVYKAFNECMAMVRSGRSDEVPVHLRNAPTRLMKDLGYGGEYRYAHDEPEGFAAGESYFSEALHGMRFYQPVDRGVEQKISQKLARLRELNQASPRQRYQNKESGE